MAINREPKKGEEDCIACKGKISYNMLPYPFESASYPVIPINDPFNAEGWICLSCAQERGWESVCEGTVTWCLCCEKILNWDDGNGCLNCMNPDDIYCIECWINEYGNTKDKNGYLASYHPACMPSD